MSVLGIFLVVVGTMLSTPSEIRFTQNGEAMPLRQQDDGTFKLELKAEPFMIIFPGEELQVCAGIEPGLFEHAQAGVDINADFNSNFFIYKYLAGTSDSNFLSIEKDTGMSLNPTHGAKPYDKGFSFYEVANLQLDGQEYPLSTHDRLYIALWLDKNKDQFIDQEELIHVFLEFM